MSKIDLPITRYYGSKRKLITLIWEKLALLNIEFDSVLDLFGGSGIFSYYAKKEGKQVLYNDLFKFNYYIGKALIETSFFSLSNDAVLDLLKPQNNKKYNTLIKDNFKDIYYLDEENYLIDIAVQNIESIENESDRMSAYYILFQSCLIKRPFNLFHRKNLSLRTNYTKSNFGNKVTWERSFPELFVRFAEQLRIYQFDNNKINQCYNITALDNNIVADLVYIDPPYFKQTNHVTYHSRYHFIEGLANYDNIEQFISLQKSHKEILINDNRDFENKHTFMNNLSLLFETHQNSIIVISYRNGGIPSIEEIADLLRIYKRNIHTIDLGSYSYALNRNNQQNKEYIIVGV